MFTVDPTRNPEVDSRRQLLGNGENKEASPSQRMVSQQEIFDSLAVLDLLQKDNQRRLREQEQREIEQASRLDAIAQHRAVQADERAKIHREIEDLQNSLSENTVIVKKTNNKIFLIIGGLVVAAIVTTGVVYTVLRFT